MCLRLRTIKRVKRKVWFTGCQVSFILPFRLLRQASVVITKQREKNSYEVNRAFLPYSSWVQRLFETKIKNPVRSEVTKNMKLLKKVNMLNIAGSGSSRKIAFRLI